MAPVTNIRYGGEQVRCPNLDCDNSSTYFLTGLDMNAKGTTPWLLSDTVTWWWHWWWQGGRRWWWWWWWRWWWRRYDGAQIRFYRSVLTAIRNHEKPWKHQYKSWKPTKNREKTWHKDIVNDAQVQITASVAIVTFVQKTSVLHHSVKKTSAIASLQKFDHHLLI